MSVCEWTSFLLSPYPFQYIGRRSTLGHSANFASTLERWDIAEEMDTFRFLAFYTNGGKKYQYDCNDSSNDNVGAEATTMLSFRSRWAVTLFCQK